MFVVVKAKSPEFSPGVLAFTVPNQEELNKRLENGDLEEGDMVYPVELYPVEQRFLVTKRNPLILVIC